MIFLHKDGEFHLEGFALAISFQELKNIRGFKVVLLTSENWFSKQEKAINCGNQRPKMKSIALMKPILFTT
jgi:hypothetical protein